MALIQYLTRIQFDFHGRKCALPPKRRRITTTPPTPVRPARRTTWPSWRCPWNGGLAV